MISIKNTKRVLCASLAAGLVGCTSTCPDETGVACQTMGTGELGFNSNRELHTPLESDLYWPIDLEFAPDGTAYVLDWNNHQVRRINEDGLLETIIGQDFVGDGDADLLDITPAGAAGTDVVLNHPTDIQFGPDGMLYLAAWHNHKIRVWNPETALVTVLVGRGGGFAGDGAAIDSLTRFNQPKAIVRTEAGDIYVLDQRNQRIRHIAPDGIISTVAGTGMPGFSGDGGPPLEAQLSFETGANPEPSGGMTLGPDGALYLSDGLNHRIRRIDLVANVIDTIVGTGTAGFSGDGGPGTAAEVNHVRDLEFGPDGRLFFADTENNRVRVYDPVTGIVETVAGNGEIAPVEDGREVTDLALQRPMGLAFDAEGTLYICDTFNSRVLRVPQ